jgi:hypothetical protein
MGYPVIEVALSKGPDRVGVPCYSPEDGNKCSFRNIMFFSYLEFRTMDKIQKLGDSEFNFIINWVTVAAFVWRIWIKAPLLVVLEYTQAETEYFIRPVDFQGGCIVTVNILQRTRPLKYIIIN